MSKSEHKQNEELVLPDVTIIVGNNLFFIYQQPGENSEQTTERIINQLKEKIIEELDLIRKSDQAYENGEVISCQPNSVMNIVH